MQTPVILLCFSEEHLESNVWKLFIIQEICSRVGGHEKRKILLNICAIFKHQTKAHTWSECLSLCCGNADPGTEQGCGKLFTTCPKAMALLQDCKNGTCSASIFCCNCCRDKTWSKRKFHCTGGKKNLSFQHRKFTCFVEIPPTKKMQTKKGWHSKIKVTQKKFQKVS